MNNRIQELSGWHKAKLGEVAQIIRGISFPTTAKAYGPTPGHVVCLRTSNVQRDVEWNNLWFIPEQYVKRPDQFLFVDDILISTANSYELVGKVALVRDLPEKATLGAFIAAIRPSTGMLPKFLYYQLCSTEKQQALRKTASTTTNISNISTAKVLDLELGIASKEDQANIVSKIEELFSDLDAGVAALKRAQANLKRYRASVLKAAVEGRLTEEWRAAHPPAEPAAKLLARILAERRKKWEAAQLKKYADAGKAPPKDWQKKYSEPAAPDTSDLPELPEGWCWSSLGQSFAVMVGATPSRKEKTYWGGDIPWVSSGEVQFCRIFSTREAITQEGLNNSSVKLNPRGSVLLGMIGEGKTRGQAAILEIDACNNQNCAAILVSDTAVLSEYVYYWLASQYELTRQAGSGNNQPALNKALVEKIFLPLPSIAEQIEIVSKTESILSKIDHAETEIKHSLERAARLRQAILKRAFEGRLL